MTLTVSQTRYFYNSGKIFDNPSWNISHGICLDKSIKYLEDTFEGIFLYDRESVKLKLKVGECWLFGTPDVIGRVGNTGKSTGPHLHCEVRRQGVALNPAKFISFSK